MRRSLRKYRDDPLVVFAADRVQAAIRHDGVSVAALARALRVRQPTLYYVCSGKNRRCRRSLLEKMAKRFRVQRRWLEGDPDAGPYVDRQVELAKRQGTVFDPWELREGLPPFAELRASKLVDDILGAWQRDLRSGVAPAPPPDTTIGQVWRDMNEENRWIWIGAWLERLILQPTVYRQLAYRLPGKITAGQAELFDWLGSPDDSMSASLVDVLERLLAPWLEGSRPLNYPAAYAFLQALADRMRAVSRTIDGRYFGERAKEQRERTQRRRA